MGRGISKQELMFLVLNVRVICLYIENSAYRLNFIFQDNCLNFRNDRSVPRHAILVHRGIA